MAKKYQSIEEMPHEVRNEMIEKILHTQEQIFFNFFVNDALKLQNKLKHRETKLKIEKLKNEGLLK